MSDAALVLARFWGLPTLPVSAIVFLRPSVLVELKRLTVENRPFALLYGIVPLVPGLASLVLHNRRDGWLHDMVSPFGRLCLLKGVIVLAHSEASCRTRFELRLASTRIALAVARARG